MSPYDPESMGCRGLQHYMSYILPAIEWTNDAMRPALVTILRRLDKVFQKISKKPSIRVRVTKLIINSILFYFTKMNLSILIHLYI